MTGNTLKETWVSCPSPCARITRVIRRHPRSRSRRQEAAGCLYRFRPAAQRAPRLYALGAARHPGRLGACRQLRHRDRDASPTEGGRVASATHAGPARAPSAAREGACGVRSNESRLVRETKRVDGPSNRSTRDQGRLSGCLNRRPRAPHRPVPWRPGALRALDLRPVADTIKKQQCAGAARVERRPSLRPTAPTPRSRRTVR